MRRALGSFRNGGMEDLGDARLLTSRVKRKKAVGGSSANEINVETYVWVLAQHTQKLKTLERCNSSPPPLFISFS